MCGTQRETERNRENKKEISTEDKKERSIEKIAK